MRIGRSRMRLTYHGRVGHPIVHETKSGRKFIMVRARGGGTKRLYLHHGGIPKRLQHKVKHRR